MLTTLRIRNLALVADLTLELQPGLNVISGETGAGKSMLIGALNLLLGQRADRNALRSGAESCTVEAVLDLSRLAPTLDPFLAEHGLEPAEDGQWILKRTFSATGSNRQFVNGSPTSLQTLAALGEFLVDIHGPHDHQSLFQPARQLALLDGHAGLDDLRRSLEALHDERAARVAEKTRWAGDDAAYARQLDLLRHQVEEITAARLQPGEEETLESEHTRATNAARLLELAQAGLALLAEQDDAILSHLGQLGRITQDLARLDASADSLARLQAAAVESLQELSHALSAYAESVDLDSDRLQALEERLNLLHSLRRKYGGTAAAILEFGQRAREELEQLEGREGELQRANAEIERLDAALATHAARLTAARRKAIPPLVRAVRSELRDLGFRQSEFQVELRPAPSLLRSGADTVEFLFTPNPGEPPRPLRIIASSGELARVMLALKTVLAAQDDIPVVVFDEVDANVGGETAHVVGRKMREIGRRRQVLCITHLAQVAAHAHAHYLVSKSTRDGRTTSSVQPIRDDARIHELARMLGGGAAAEHHARALLDERTGSSPRPHARAS